MKSLFHCVWTGPSFTYTLKSFIKRWVKCFRRSQSNFELVLWTTADSYNELSQYLKTGVGNHIDILNWSKRIPGIDIRFNLVTLAGCKFYVAKIEPLLLKYPPSLRELVTLCSQHKRYTTISNVARLLALNHCGGIYSDIDYLTPRRDDFFPCSISEIVSVFRGCSSIDFYLPVMESKGRILIENQCMILPPKNIGALTPLLENMASNIKRDFDLIRGEAQQYSTYLDNAQTKALNKSMFTDGLYNDLLQAYKNRDYTAFLETSTKLYKDQVMQKTVSRGPISLIKHEPMLSYGALHDSYLMTSQHTYRILGQFFHNHLVKETFSLNRIGDILTPEYSKRYWIRFKQFFNPDDMAQQFSFKDSTGTARGMYSWANPGYSRLAKLEHAVHVVEKYYLKKRLNKQLIIEYIRELIKGGQSTQDRFQTNYLQGLIEQTEKLQMQTLSQMAVRRTLRQIYAIALIRHGRELTSIAETAVRMINKQHFLPLKNYIDPEKGSLSYDDLDAFVMG